MSNGKSNARVVIPAAEAESVKMNLQKVQDELIRVRDKAREEAEALDRIRGMIDLKYLNDLLSAIESLEERVKAMEKDSEAELIRKQLEAEQQRLAKLWDAFKTQEDDLRNAERDRDALLARLEEMEAEFKSMGSLAAVRAKLKYLEKENSRMETELAKASRLAQDYRQNFEKEQERLAKLYKVYEDQAERLEAFDKAEAAWHEWRQKYWDQLPADAKRAGAKPKKLTPK